MRKQYRKKEIKELMDNFLSRFGSSILDKNSEVIEVPEGLVVDGTLGFFKVGEDWVPTLKMVSGKSILPKIVVDMGAVKFVVSGADIMRPGIVKFSECAVGSYVVVVDVTHGKELCIGKMLFSSSDASNMSSGKIVKNLHYVGDSIWNFK